MLITRYLIKNILSITLFVTLTLTMVIWLTQSLRFLELIVNSNAPTGIFLQLVALSLPKFLEVVLPLSLVTAIIFFYNKMASDNELIVMRACGINQTNLAKPAVYIALCVTFTLLSLSMWLAPAAHAKMQYLRQEIKAQYSAFLIQEGVFNNVTDGLTVYVRKQRPNGKLEGLLIHDSRKKDKPPITVMAKNGQLIVTEKAPSVIVYDGSRQQVNEQNNTLTRLNFAQYIIEIEGLKKQVNKRWRKANERSFWELLNPDLNNSLDVKYKKTFVAEAHKRITASLYALSLTMISLACLLVGPFNRRGQSKRILTAVALIIIFEGTSLGLANLAEQYLFAIIMMYALAIFPVLICAFLLTAQGELFRKKLFARQSPSTAEGIS